MANENAFIWQVKSGADSGAKTGATPAADVQAFNPDSNRIEDGAFINNIAISFRKSTPENEAAATDNNEIQDMGISGFDISMAGQSGNVNNNVVGNWLNKLIKWVKDGNTTTGYKKGRFGLRLDNIPQFNVVPNANANSLGSTYGFFIINPAWEYLGERKDRISWSLTLSLSGDPLNAL